MAAHTFKRRYRLIGSAAGLVGAGALAVAMAAPASAAVTDVAITTPSGFGSSEGVYGTGCSYDVAATLSNLEGGPVVFAAKLGDAAAVPFASVTPSADADSNKVSATWSPAAPGTYTITATQGASVKDVEAKVGTGLQLPEFLGGGNCVVLSS